MLVCMASSLWASRVASSLRISVFRRGYTAFTEDSVAAVLRKDLKYAWTHAWVKVEGNVATVGITRGGQWCLTPSLVSVALPKVGNSVTRGSMCADLYDCYMILGFSSPVSGKVVEVNDRLGSHPQLVMKSPYDEGWLIKVEMSEPAEVNNLMDVEQYRFCWETSLTRKIY